MAFSVLIPPNVNVIPISPTSSWPCLYTRHFYGRFCIFTSPWWAYVYIFYVYMWHTPYTCPLLVTYSVCMELSDCPFLHTPPQVDLFSISTKSSWPTLYTSNFYDLFRSLTCLLWDYFMKWYFMATYARTSVDLFCIHTSSLWPILHMRNFLKSYTLYIFPNVLCWRKKIRTLCDLVFNLVTFMAYFVNLLLS